ncbi:MAG: YggT family protein [Actinobacteria bacterium]|nr:YggT family protein [Actinomycetota bacterium]
MTVFAAGPPGPINVVVADLLSLYALALIAMMVLSWFPLRPDGPIAKVQRFLLRITDPLVVPLRNAMPSMGMIDPSPLIVLLAVYFLRGLVLG